MRPVFGCEWEDRCLGVSEDLYVIIYQKVLLIRAIMRFEMLSHP